MKRREEGISTTVAHRRKGNYLIIEHVTGNIRITSQGLRTSELANDTILIDATGSANAHDHLQIKGSKGKVTITGQNAQLMTPVDLQIAVPSGISVRIGNVIGAIMITETIEVLAVANARHCQIFTELLHGAIFQIGSDVDIKVKRLIGHCDIIAEENAKVEVREATISTLAANISGNAQVNLYGSVRFARLDLKRQAYLYVGLIEDFVSQRKDKQATLDYGRIGSRHADDDAKHRALIHQANEDMQHFLSAPLPAANA